VFRGRLLVLNVALLLLTVAGFVVAIRALDRWAYQDALAYCSSFATTPSAVLEPWAANGGNARTAAGNQQRFRFEGFYRFAATCVVERSAGEVTSLRIEVEPTAFELAVHELYEPDQRRREVTGDY